MFVFFIGVILWILGLIGLIVWVVNYNKSYEGGLLWGTMFWVCGGLSWIFLLVPINFNIGTSTLTGYIYSSDSTVGYTTGHIRFSENAGQDVQPSFCVKSDSIPGEQTRELAGSGKKVKITIPPYFYFSNNPFACGTTEMKIVEIK